MITPTSIPDVDVTTDDEILAAYHEEGVGDGAARAYLDAIRGRSKYLLD